MNQHIVTNVLLFGNVDEVNMDSSKRQFLQQLGV